MKLIATLVAAAFAAPAFAQDKPAATPAPSWQGGRPPAMAESTLHPFAPHMTGRPAKETAGRQAQGAGRLQGRGLGRRHPRGALADAGRQGHGVRQQPQSSKDVYAVVDNGGKREVQECSRASTRPTASPSTRARCTSPSATASRATTASRTSSTTRRRRRSWSTTSTRRTQAGHFWKYLAFGPDGKLYFNIGAPGNIVMPPYMQASIMRVDPNDRLLENVARGRAQFGRLRLAPEDQGALVHQPRARLARATTSPNDTLHRVPKKGDATSAIRSATRATCSIPSSARTARATSSTKPAR